MKPCVSSTAAPRPCSCPGEEDFGIVPVEAQACGRPVVALGRGGALETVVDGVTGVLVDGTDAGRLGRGVRRIRDGRAAGRPSTPAAIRASAERFSRERFLTAMAAEIARARRRAPPQEAARW